VLVLDGIDPVVGLFLDLFTAFMLLKTLLFALKI
jgi:hypothetical protein